jgi:hypothetical protein
VLGGSRDRPDAAIVTPTEAMNIEITLKSDWAMLERGTGVEGRQAARMNAQRVHKISQIPAHIMEMMRLFPAAVQFRAVVISDAPPSDVSRRIMLRWLNEPLFNTPKLNVVWMVT